MRDSGHPTLLLQNLPSAFFFVDRAGRIADLNPALLAMPGMEEEQLLGRPPEKLLDTADLESEMGRGSTCTLRIPIQAEDLS